MEVDRVHVRHCIILLLHQGNSVAEATKSIFGTYGERVLSERVCLQILLDGNPYTIIYYVL